MFWAIFDIVISCMESTPSNDVSIDLLYPLKFKLSPTLSLSLSLSNILA